MTPTSPRAFLLSAALHATAVALALLFGYAANRPDRDAPRVLELVAGEGDNFAAKEAPALGTEGGVKLTVPIAPTPKPLPPAPVTPAPVAPAPAPVAPAPKAKATAPVNDAVPNFKKKLLYEVVRGDAKAKLQLRREREAEAKRKAAEKKRQEEEARRLTKEEFDRAQKNKTTAKNAPVKVARIDGEGIAKGVIGGSANNKVGGAGGNALRTDNDDVLGAYYAMFKQRVYDAFLPQHELSNTLTATVTVYSSMDGTLANLRITRSSGSREVDRAILEAIRRVRMPPRPEGRKAEDFVFDFVLEIGKGSPAKG